MKAFQLIAKTETGKRAIIEYLKFRNDLKGASITKRNNDPLTIECRITSDLVLSHMKEGQIEKVIWAVFVGLGTRLKLKVTKRDYSLVMVE